MAARLSRIIPGSLTLLAAVVLSACTSQQAPVLKEGEKPVDVASVVRQKMPASVKDREAWAQAIATAFDSQKLAPTEENVCSVLAVAQQESNYQSDPVVPGLNKIAWQEIDRRAENAHSAVSGPYRAEDHLAKRQKLQRPSGQREDGKAAERYF